MYITWCYNRAKHKTMAVRGRMKGIGKLFCTFIFYIVATLWIRCAFFDFFRFFLFKLIRRKRLFSMAFTILINLFLKTFLIRSCFFADDFLFEFMLIRTRFHMCGINE